MRPRVAWIEAGDASNVFPRHRSRDAMTRSLLKCTGLSSLVLVCGSRPATDEDLLPVHSRQYISILRRTSFALANAPRYQFVSLGPHMRKLESAGLSSADVEAAGLVTDCLPFPRMWEYVQAVCGASIAAVEVVAHNRARVAISISGGRHHAQPTSASGFCYGNDCAIALLRLRSLVNGDVLYVDLDAHHCDGTEDALSGCPGVHCLSLHCFGEGVYPCTGGPGTSRAGSARRGAVVNLPLRKGCGDTLWLYVLRQALKLLTAHVPVRGVVVQCGVDGLGADPRKLLNLSSVAFRHAIQSIVDMDVPTVILGGGGYNDTAAAAAMMHVVDVALGADASTPNFIPAYMLPGFPGHARLAAAHIGKYLTVKASLASDGNTKASLDRELRSIARLLAIPAPAFSTTTARAGSAKAAQQCLHTSRKRSKHAGEQSARDMVAGTDTEATDQAAPSAAAREADSAAPPRLPGARAITTRHAVSSSITAAAATGSTTELRKRQRDKDDESRMHAAARESQGLQGQQPQSTRRAAALPGGRPRRRAVLAPRPGSAGPLKVVSSREAMLGSAIAPQGSLAMGRRQIVARVALNAFEFDE